MKKKTTAILSAALALLLTGFSIYTGTKIFSQEPKAEAGVRNQSNLEETKLSGEFTAPPEDKENVSSITSNTSEKAESKSEKVESKEVKPEPQTPPPSEKTKSINANGKTYTADFKEITKSYDKNKRDLYVYYTDDRSVEFQYDCITGDLLNASIRFTNEPEHKITENQAKAIAEDFIKKNCNDFSSYTFDEIIFNETSGYIIYYSKHIDGYISVQRIGVRLTGDGNIKSYYHNKYVFDGIDTNVKIDGDKLAKELDEMIKKRHPKMVSYTVMYQAVDIDHDGNLAMRYSVDVVQEERTDFLAFYVPIK